MSKQNKLKCMEVHVVLCDYISLVLYRSVHFNFQRYVKCILFAGTDDIVGPEGMEKFCEDIGVEPENVS